MAAKATIEILPQLQGARGAHIIERFRALVDVKSHNDCWVWKGSCKDGYGRFKTNPYTTVVASRFALVLATRDERLDLHALHSCDNPPCCNPRHLRWGTPAENTQDKLDRGRNRTADQAGLNNGACKLRPGDLEQIIEGFRCHLSNMAIARDLPVSHALVSRIRTGRSWQKEAAALGWVPKPLIKHPSHPLLTNHERMFAHG